MKYSVLFALTFSFLFAQCKPPDAKVATPEIVPRDTTITPQNAYADLFLDSAYVEGFIKTAGVSDSAAQRIRNFYNARNYGFAWFDEEGLTVQAQGFWNAHERYMNHFGDSSLYDRRLHTRMEEWLEADTTPLIPKDTLHQTELQLTQHFFAYVKYAYAGKTDPEKMQWHIPQRKLDATALLRSLLSNAQNTKEWQPLNPSFHRLQNAAARYYALEKIGGWNKIELPAKTWKKGERGAFITQVKKRLQLSGEYSSTDTSALFTDSLQTAVKKARKRFGLKEDGQINAALVNALNVPVGERLRQMLINLERMKWMPAPPPDFIIVNIPEYRLHVYENGAEVLGMDVVVGKAANRTIIFSDSLKYVVFSPYWNIPRSIVRSEIVPAMQRSRSYLRRKNMEVTGYSGGLPVVRQRPGPGNALGKVKFIFPNQYNIYFHDTPARSLFGREKRAFSHGCIRLAEPAKMAQYLLRNDPAWTAQNVKDAMNRETEKWVTLDASVPVFITYVTAWVDDEGVVHFREDIYGHDQRMADDLFV